MSYDINIYETQFLRRALSEGLDDWTSAPDFDESARTKMIFALREHGFLEVPHEPSFLEFAAAQGFPVSRDLVRDDEEILATASVFGNVVVLSVPISDRADGSIEQCLRIARGLVENTEFCTYDPQSGVVHG